jgi:phosphate:Na+ symporter
MGRVSIGLGLIILALQLIVEAAAPITHAQGVKVLFASLTGDILLDALIGALFAMISYSSLAAVLLTATLAGAGVISLPVAIGLVIGANIGSGVLAFLSTSMQNAAGRQVALGSLLYKLIGLLLIIPVLDPLVHWMDSLDYSPQGLVIGFHLLYNTARCLVLLPSVGPMARLCAWLLPERPETNGQAKARHLDLTALVTPSLALANAARETLRMGDLIENMLQAMLDVLHGKQTAVPQQMRSLSDDVEALYSAIKQTLPGADAPRRPERPGQPALGRNHRTGDQPETGLGPDRAHVAQSPAAKDLAAPLLFRCGPGRTRRAAPAVDCQPAPGALSVPQRRQGKRPAIAA